MKASKQKAYLIAKEQYAEFGVNAEQALKKLAATELSLPCWQGDDVIGFEFGNKEKSGSIIAIGKYPGRARNVDELRMDLETAQNLVPGKMRINLHSIYGEFSRPVERDRFDYKHFKGWVDWAKERKRYIDFNATLFAHSRARDFTLSSLEPDTRRFWIEHVKCCRAIAQKIGKELKNICLHNLWIPDGMKDRCIGRGHYRAQLKQSLDQIYCVHHEKDYIKDSLEPKLFGIGTESCVIGSHEFYLAYALKNDLMLCLDLGHYHPTESIADKLSALLQFFPEILIHVSRGIRWDSDHVPVFNDELVELAHEIVLNNALSRVHLALDFFDATINRVAAWVIGAQAVLKSLLYALLAPNQLLFEHEKNNDYTSRLLLLEAAKSLPFSAVWEYYCVINDVPGPAEIRNEIKKYEQDHLFDRN